MTKNRVLAFELGGAGLVLLIAAGLFVQGHGATPADAAPDPKTLITCPGDAYQAMNLDHDGNTAETRTPDQIITDVLTTAGRNDLKGAPRKTIYASTAKRTITVNPGDGPAAAVFAFEQLDAGGLAVAEYVTCWEGPR